MVEWIQFVVGTVLLLLGLGIFAVEMIGVYRFKYVLNRMHAAAMGDTLGIGFCLVGLIVMNGLNLTSLKLFFVVCFLWFSSPTSSHLIARLEVTTDTEKEKHYRELPLSALEEELRVRGEAGETEMGVEGNASVQIGETVTGETDVTGNSPAQTKHTGTGEQTIVTEPVKDETGVRSGAASETDVKKEAAAGMDAVQASKPAHTLETAEEA